MFDPEVTSKLMNVALADYQSNGSFLNAPYKLNHKNGRYIGRIKWRKCPANERWFAELHVEVPVQFVGIHNFGPSVERHNGE